MQLLYQNFKIIKKTILGKNPPRKKTPDPKPNSINLVLTLPLNPHRGLFSEGGDFFLTPKKRIIFISNLKCAPTTLRKVLNNGGLIIKFFF